MKRGWYIQLQKGKGEKSELLSFLVNKIERNCTVWFGRSLAESCLISDHMITVINMKLTRTLEIRIFRNKVVSVIYLYCNTYLPIHTFLQHMSSYLFTRMCVQCNKFFK